jgi:hypothetical protein
MSWRTRVLGVKYCELYVCRLCSAIFVFIIIERMERSFSFFQRLAIATGGTMHHSDKQHIGSVLNEVLMVCRNDMTQIWFVALSSPPNLSGVRVIRSLAICVCFVDRCLSFCTFSFGHCIVCSSSIYGFIFKHLFHTNYRKTILSDKILLWSHFEHITVLCKKRLKIPKG